MKMTQPRHRSNRRAAIGRHSTCLVLAVLVAGFAAAGCPAAQQPERESPVETAGAVVLPTAPTLAELANATFRGIHDAPVTLTAGRWEGEPFEPGGSSRPSVGLVDHFSLQGDLDGDGRLEAVRLLWSSSGGSGTRNYLAVVERTADGLRNRATTLIGDRVQIRSGRIEGSEIVLDLVRHGPQDPACCPTERAVVRWALDGDTLVVALDETIGEVSLSDLEGEVWRLLTLGRNDPVPEDLQMTLAVNAGQVSGTAGCNRYLGSITSESPGELRCSAIAASKKACPAEVMAFETRFLEALGGATQFDFLAGRLALTGSTGDGMTTLMFEASPATD